MARSLAVVGSILLLAVLAIAGRRVWTWRPSVERAQWAIDRNELDAADEILSQLVKRRSPPAEAYLLAAQVAAKRDEFKKSLEYLRAIPENNPLAAEALLRQGQCLRELDFGRQAEDAWKAAVARLAQPNLARWELLELYYVEYRLSDALALAWEVYDAEPNKIPALLVMLRFELERPAPHFGVSVVEPFVANDPEDWEARLALGRYYVLLGNPAGRVLLEECAKNHPQRIDFLHAYLWGLGELGEYQTLDELCRSAPPPLLEEPDYWRLHGQAIERTDQSAALAAYRRALQLDPFHRKVHFQLGQLLRRTAGLEAAQPHLDRAKELLDIREALADHYTLVYQNRSNVSAAECARMGELNEALGRMREARAWHEQALRRDPNLPDSRAAIERLNKTVGATGTQARSQ